ncbi:MAG: sugar phosphate isomerase/epimerase [Oscillospiraceae bacterium]|nr:sugar phosphate isomerase/epimerase [Oscillospiraceae bacterium]
MIRIGRCVSLSERFDALCGEAAAYGYAYLELALRSLEELSAEELARARETAEEHGLEIYSTNLFLPGRLSFFDADKSALYAYAHSVLVKAASLGVRVAVLGAGDARRRPAGMAEVTAEAWLLEAFKALADIASGYGVIIALEPLNKLETNMITTTAQALEYISLVGHPHLRLLIDYYHFCMEREDPAIIQRAGPVLAHTHLATPLDRQFPSPERAGEYRGFFEALRHSGYRGGMSVECDFSGEAAAGGVHHLPAR